MTNDRQGTWHVLPYRCSEAPDSLLEVLHVSLEFLDGAAAESTIDAE